MVKLTIPFATLLLGASTALSASLQQVNNFGTNPTNVRMFIYVPDKIASSTNAPVLVAAHYCTGTAQAYFSGTPYRQLADQHGFIVIYPNAPDSGGCWDVHTQATFTHNGGGDSRGIASMVTYTLDKYKANPERVYVTGSSSGAMMTQVLMGAYPDIFKGGAAFAGVPFGCFGGSGMWNSQCAQGQQSRTAKAWGDLVRNAYPGYTGPRPKLAIYHGTNDETLNYNNHKEAIKQWTNVFGYSETPTSTQSNSPVNGWTRSIYGPLFQAISAQGVTHNLPIQGNDVMNWFQLNVANPTTPAQPGTTSQPTGTTTVPPVVTPTPTPTPTQPAGTVAKYGQCGGNNYSGPTGCVSGSTCVKLNDWYSQCQ